MDKTTALVVFAITMILVGGFVALSFNNRDTASYAIFLSGPAVSALLGGVILRLQTRVQKDVAEVKAATNGQLDAKFAQVTDGLHAASTERRTIAADVAAVKHAQVVSGVPVDPAI